MNKYLLVALAVFSLLSCSKSENNTTEQEEVKFEKFQGTWKGTREAITENGAITTMKDCKKQLNVEFRKDNLGNWVRYEDACEDPNSFMGYNIDIKNNTIVDKIGNEAIFYYSFEGNNTLKVETINYTALFDEDAYQAELEKLIAEGKVPTTEQITALTAKYTQKIKHKITLNKQ